MMNPARPCIGLSAGLLLLSACSEGGSEERPTSEVTISASHRMYGAGGKVLVLEFPIPSNAAGSDLGVFNMNDQSEYTISRGSQTSAPLAYNLAKDGLLNVVVPVTR